MRVALWRALHVELDPPPHVLDDQIGLRLADPADGWRDRGDMDPVGTSRFRASIVVRSRFVEDLLAEQAGRVGQYVLLGAGLETFAQRRPDIAERYRIFEVDQPRTQAWKRQRLVETGYGLPEWLHSVPVDFETDSWWERLRAAGFDAGQPAVVASLGVSMYLTDAANRETLSLLARSAPGSTVVMTFQPPIELLDEQDRPSREFAVRGAAGSGTPFLSFYTPAQLVDMARAAGFVAARHVSAADLNTRYFSGRTDGLRTSNGEELLVATT
ncbi:class I SAM-dependent methyltransferase [Nocardia spumae]|uniref:class I SAM-dependent methyltransferase n=1 Tax=Nocardia spumae TaxID=2887190 RepID=UPI001D13593A|nr:class I SAM-dependent methyltransferase [Nocardia spumae]